MPDLAANRDLFDALQAVNRKVRAMFDARVKARGLTLARARALFILSRRDGINQKELADELGIETPTIVRLLDGLEAQGFVERRMEPADRRAKQVHLTPRGRRIGEDIEGLAAQIRADLLAGVEGHEKEVALKVMRTMSRNMPAREREATE